MTPSPSILSSDARGRARRDHAIQIVDLDRNERVARTETGGVPGQILVLSDGRVLVTLTDENRVAVFEAAPGDVPSLSPRCSTGTDVEPAGLAATPDESTVLVTSRTGRTVAFYATKSMTRTDETEVPRDPYGVTVSSDGRTAFVTHVAGSRITTVSLGDRPRSKELTIEGQPDPVQVRQIRQLEANLIKSGQPKLEATRIALESTLRSKRKSVQGFAIARSDPRRGTFDVTTLLGHRKNPASTPYAPPSTGRVKVGVALHE